MASATEPELTINPTKPTSSRRRWTVAGAFLGIGLVAWLLSMGAGRLAGGFLVLPDGAELADIDAAPAGDIGSGAPDGEGRVAGAGGSSSRKQPARFYSRAIHDRNIFDSNALGVEDSGGDEEVGDSDRKSDLKVVLLATVVAQPDSYSSALIAEEKGDGAAGYGIGDNLLDEGTIVRIEQRRVIIKRSDGTVEYIAMEEGKSFKKESDSGSSKAKSDDEDEDIQKTGDNKYVVEQELVDKILENPEKLYSQVRVVPHKGADGEIDGYRLSGIRRKSFFARLGVKNGDIVHAVNGKPLTSMSAAMEAYNSMQSSKDFNFDLTRRNQKQTFEYEIR